MICGDESLGSKPQLLYYCQGYILRGAGERNCGYICSAVIANKLQTALFSASTFSLASHTGISSCVHRQILTKCKKLVTMVRMIK